MVNSTEALKIETNVPDDAMKNENAATVLGTATPPAATSSNSKVGKCFPYNDKFVSYVKFSAYLWATLASLNIIRITNQEEALSIDGDYTNFSPDAHSTKIGD